MPESKPSAGAGRADSRDAIIHRLTDYFRGRQHLRKGLCLLNAAEYERAAAELGKAAALNPDSEDLPTFLLHALVGAGRDADATVQLQRRLAADPTDVSATVQLALIKWRSNDALGAIEILREAVAVHAESAELHFQLGALLAAIDHDEEAELRFTQAVAIDKNHPDALVALGMCCGTRSRPSEAVRHLLRAQKLRPHDAKTALLLSVAAKAADAVGEPVAICTEMPAGAVTASDEAMEELSRVIEHDPDFADAVLSLDQKDVDEDAFAMLARTLQMAIHRNPRQAALYYQCGRVLQRLGRTDEAIQVAERAVDIDPRYIKALILLARLYQQTDRYADAAARLEQTVVMGAEYADTYYLLGNLYRDTGQLERARWAYEHALKINHRYRAAQQALASLAA